MDTRNELLIERVTHRYGRAPALEDVSLSIEEGEFVTLLGPSGCGKTTLLRIVAGFLQPSEGRLLLKDRDITRLPAHRRPVNMVFQRSTLFPHLDVYGNVAFGLRVARVPKTEIQQRVSAALALVRLEGFERRRSHELSGGQIQRVALARALVNRPQLLLLDEPLASLDLKIRLEMEVELRRVHHETGATFVYVTHDQREALALSDRIVVFNHGRIEQVGAPADVYHGPASPFAARFVGDANVIPVDVVSTTDAGTSVMVGAHQFMMPGLFDSGSGSAWLVLRPEVVRLMQCHERDVVSRLDGVVRDVAFRGTGLSYRVDVPGLPEPVKAEIPTDGSPPLPLGAEVTVLWDLASCRLLPRDEGVK